MNTKGNNRERWTDERLDRLADDVSELRQGLSDTKDSVDGLRITAQALLQIAAQHQQADQERQEEIRQMNERFNAQQAEIRQINERLDVQQGQIKILLERLLGS